MATQKPTILIVDDQPKDAAVIECAVLTCLKFFKEENNFETRIADGCTEAASLIKSSKPKLIITDLFIPDWEPLSDRDFSKLSLTVQCDEMETPHGIQFLRGLKNRTDTRKLVTTFFWNYPGFARYRDDLAGLADGILPKDIFYLVAGLNPDQKFTEAVRYAPVRILAEILMLLLKQENLSPMFQPMRFVSLFEEASSWLNTFPHYVLELRNETILDPESDTKGPQLVTRRAYKPWDDYGEIINHTLSIQWMPQFVFRSTLPRKSLSADGIYKRIMRQIDEGEWRIDVRIPALYTVNEEIGLSLVKHEFRWNAKTRTIKQPSRTVQIATVDLLHSGGRRRAKDDHQRWAQILVTLGFFSYWCHLSDHRAVRKDGELLDIMKLRAKTPYAGGGGKPENIAEDLELLELSILKKLRNEYHNDWWRFYRANRDMRIFGRQRLPGNEYGSWLNASLILDLR